MSGFLLGVDGGGSKTLARIASVGPENQFCLHGAGQSSGSNPLSRGYDAAQAALTTAVSEAIESAGVSAAEITGGLLAIAGAKSPGVAAKLQQWVDSQSWGAGCRVVPDTEPLLHSAKTHPYAIAVVAGTGSVALARGPSGVVHTLGGWGYLLGDEGSGYALGQAAIRHAMHELERQRELSVFTKHLLTHLEISSLEEATALIKTHIYGSDNPRERIAAIAPCVTRLTHATDHAAREVATDMICQRAKELAELVARAAHQAELSEQPFSLAIVGGLLLGCTLLQTKLLDQLTEQGLSVSRVEQLADVATACFRLAK